MAESKTKAVLSSILRAAEHIERIAILIAALLAAVPVIQWFAEREDRILERRATLVSSYLDCLDVSFRMDERERTRMEAMRDLSPESIGNDDIRSPIKYKADYMNAASSVCGYLFAQIDSSAFNMWLTEDGSLPDVPSLEELLAGDTLDEEAGSAQPHERRPNRSE